METDIAAIRSILEQAVDPVGIGQGFVCGLVFMAGFWVWFRIRKTWDRDDV